MRRLTKVALCVLAPCLMLPASPVMSHDHGAAAAETTETVAEMTEKVAVDQHVPEKSSQVTLTLHVKQQGEPSTFLPSRLSIYGSDGNYYPPAGHVVLPYDRGFGIVGETSEPDLMNCVVVVNNACQNQTESRQWSLDADGIYEVTVPLGQSYTVLAARGLEYVQVETPLDLGATEPQIIWLPQGPDMEMLNWMSADSHVHTLLPEAARWQADIEDLDYVNLMFMGTNHVLYQNHFTMLAETSANGRTTYVAEEVRDMLYGHVTTFNLKAFISADGEFGQCVDPPDPPPPGQPQEICDDHDPLMWEIYQEVEDQGGALAFHAHADYWPGHGIGLAAVHDHVDGHEWSSPAFSKPRKLRALDSPSRLGEGNDFNYLKDTRNLEYDGTDLYYSMLSSGVRVPLIAGTDKMGRYTPVGGTVRTYAKVASPGHEQWLAAAENGQTFITNGPLVESFQVDGQDVGGELFVTGPTTVQVTASVWSAVSFDHLEVVINGEVEHSEPVPSGGLPIAVSIDEMLPIDQSSWVALRAYSDTQDFQRIWYGGLYGAKAGAHTSPIYVTMTDALGDPIPVASAFYDAQLMLDYNKGTQAFVAAEKVPENFATSDDKNDARGYADRTADYFAGAIDYAYAAAGSGNATLDFLQGGVSAGGIDDVSSPVYSGGMALAHDSGASNDSYTLRWYGVDATPAGALDSAERYGFKFSVFGMSSSDTPVALFVFCRRASGPHVWTTRSFVATPSWQKFEIVGLCPANTVSLGARLDVDQAGRTVYWDSPLIVWEESRVDNGDFESGGLEPFGPVGSTTVAASNGGQLTLETAGSNKIVRHFAVSDYSYSAPYYGKKVVDVDPAVQHSFRFSAAARGDQEPNTIRLLVAWELADPLDHPTAPGQPYDYKGEFFPITTSWETYQLTGTCPLGTDALRIRLEKATGGASPAFDVLWDDLVFSILE